MRTSREKIDKYNTADNVKRSTLTKWFLVKNRFILFIIYA